LNAHVWCSSGARPVQRLGAVAKSINQALHKFNLRRYQSLSSCPSRNLSFSPSTMSTTHASAIDEKEPLILSESDIGSESDLTDDESEAEHESKSTKKGSEVPPPVSDPRFDQPTPSPFKRAALIVFTLFLFWLAVSMRKSIWEGTRPRKVIYASR
jgi:hypothetical protein